MDLHVFQPIEVSDALDGPLDFGEHNWALLTAQKEDKVNTMTISWGGITYVWGKSCCIVYVRESRYTKEFIDASRRFSLSFLNHDEFRGAKNYLGAVSGRDEDKIENAKLNVNYFEDVPFIDEADNVIICKVLYKHQMREEDFVSGRVLADHYRTGDYHYMYIGEIKRIMIR